MREFRDPLQGGSNDYDLDEQEEDLEVRSDQAAPGKRSRTAHLEGLADPSLVARARRLGTPPTIPLRYAPASNLIGAIYRKQAPSAVPDADASRQVELAQSSRGEALPEKLRRRIELALGADLKDVRIHLGSESAAAARSVGARAYTVGRQVHFASGEYDPDSKAGQRLIAHELAHAVQQKGSSAAPSDELQVSSPGDTLEVEADRFADAFVAKDGPNRAPGLGVSPTPLSPVSVGVSRAVLHRDTSPVQLIADSFAGSPDKAKSALRKAGGNRASVVQAIKQVFSDEQAKEIIKAVPAGGGQAPPQVKGADAKPQKKSGKPAQDAGAAGGKGKKGGAGAKGGGGGGQPTAGGKATGAGGEPKADRLPDEITTSELQLIYQEIVEHEAWAGARAAVGEAGSSERAAFIAEQAGRGAITGFTTGAIMGAASGIVGQLAARYVPIPGVGAMIAGGMAAYGLITRDWGQTFDTIGQFGQGSSTYEVLANTIAAISEVIDLVVNIANVIAGIIGVISALMWLITIITVGVASPLAGTLSAIALGIVTVTGILDNINNLVLQPLVLLFRAMHTFTSDADPRDVEEQGAGISDAANKVASALGGMAGGKVADAAGAGAKRMAHKRAQRSGGGAPENVSTGGASKAVVEGVDTPTPHGEGATPHAEGGTPHGEGGTPHVDEPSAPTPHGEDGGAPTPHGDEGSTPAPHGDEGGPPTQHAEAEGSPTQPGQEPGTPARQDEGPGVDPATRQQRAQDAVNESNSRWDRVKETYRNRRDALKKEFTDHWAKQKAESLEHQQRLDEAERRGQQQRREEIDRDAQTAKDRADTEYEDAVRRGESDARTEADNQLRRDRDAAGQKYLEAEQRANAAERDAHMEAARTRRQQKSDAMDSYSRERSRIRQERQALRDEYHEARRRLREAEAGPEAEAQLQQRYEADRARLGEELTANQDTYRAAIKAADAEYSQTYDHASQTRDDAVQAARQAREADYQTAEQMRGTREQQLAEAAKKQAEDARDSAHESADARAQRRHEGGEEARAGRRSVREERRAAANESRFGEGVREDPRTRRKKFWDFWSGAAAREKWRKTWDKARADQRQVYDDYRSRKAGGESEWQATKKSFGADRPNRITNDPTASGAGKILARGKQYVEAGVKSVVGQDQKSEEEKERAARKPKSEPFFHKAVSQPGKYWFQGGWKEAQEKKKAAQAARFAPGTKAQERTDDDRFKVSKKRVNPNYSSGPPASPVELQKIRSYIEAEYETKAKAEAAKRDAAMKKAKAEGDAPRLKELKAEAEKAQKTNDAHKASVKQKKQANVDQGRRQADADGVMPDFGNRIAGITVLETPLAAFIGFAWIGKKLGSDSFAKMHHDAVKMQKQFASMKTIFKSQESKQPANKAKQKADMQRVDAVDQKAAKSGSSLGQSHTMTVSLDTQNQQKIQQGAAAHAQASQQANEHKAKAKKGESEYKALRGKLVSWAHKHKAERDAAIAQEKNATSEPFGSDLTFPVAKITKPGEPDGGGGGGGQGDADSAGGDDQGQQGKQGKKKGQGQDQQAQDQQGKQGQPGQQGQPGGKQTSPGQQQPSPQPQEPQQSGPTQKQDGPSPAPPNQGGQSPAPSNPPDSE